MFLEERYPIILTLGLEWSGILTFVILGIWVLLRTGLWIHDTMLAPKKHLHFPVSAQRLGFAQGIAKYSVIMSDVEYKMRKGYLSLPRRIIRIWWPLLAWSAVAQFIALYGARGLANELNIDFLYALAITISALGILGLYRKSMIRDHLKETSIAEGESLDWDAEGYMGGVRLLARFEGRGRKIVLNRLEENALSKNGAQTYSYKGMMAQPEAVHTHGTGVLVSEFRMSAESTPMSEDNWLQRIQLKDVLHMVLTSYVSGNALQMPFACLLEYQGAVILIYPMAEHVEYLESVGERLRKRKNLPTISVRDVALSAAQEFYTRFDERKVAALLAHQEWIDRDNMPI